MTSAVAYLRISKDRNGEGLGVERQLEACKHLAAAKGWEIDLVLDENDTSATSSKRRPQFERLLQMMESGEAEAVVAYKVDRLVRRLDDMSRLWDVAQRQNVLLATVAGDLDLTTPSGRSNALLWSVLAAIEVDSMSDRLQRKALQSVTAGRNANGGSRPFGWNSSRTEQVPAEAAEIRLMAERLIDGWTLHAVAADLNRRGVPTAGWSERMLKAEESHQKTLQTDPNAVLEVPPAVKWDTRRIRMVVSSPRHAGIVTHRGKVVTGSDGAPVKATWDPILTLDEHDQVVAALNARARVMPSEWSYKRRHLLAGRGIMTCGICGNGLKVSRAKGDWTYRCLGHVSRSEAKVDEFVLRRVREYIVANPIRVSEVRVAEEPDVANEITRLETQLADLEENFLDQGGDAIRLARLTQNLESRLDALRTKRLSQISRATGSTWWEHDQDDVMAVLGESAASLPNTTEAESDYKARMIDLQRSWILMYTRSIRLLPTTKRGKGAFDEDAVEIEFKDVSDFWVSTHLDSKTGEWTARGSTHSGKAPSA